ncbi:hypothetical protein HPB52_016399 [Rhipicephalus sanguineus]|uniref:Peptidase M13 N-terminal domain-containing protein n=1 Tax=Rhipicephalus sanguineus TaxID=34632 RepID=A0A9D4PKU6_RHISA|nr:hypothetical protein HPB52_016399 [Rhipicephalus sanguineus]
MNVAPSLSPTCSTVAQPPTSVTFSTSTPTVPGADTVYCETEFCNREGSYIRGLLSKNKGPCDNFYDHVCDIWTSQHPVKGSGAGDVVSTDTLIQDDLSKIVKPLLTAPKSDDVRLAASLYSACCDRGKKNAAMDEIKALYKRWKIGEWPRGGDVNISDVWTFGGQLVRDMGLDALVSASIIQDPRSYLNAATLLDKPRFIFSCSDASRQSVTRLLRIALTDVASQVSTSLLDEVITAFVRFGSAPLPPSVPDTDLSTPYATKLANLDPGYRDFLSVAFNGTRSFDDVNTEVVVFRLRAPFPAHGCARAATTSNG